VAVPEVLRHVGGQRRVRVEQLVHVTDVAGSERRTEDLGVAVVAVAAAESLVVGDVARRLLQVRHQPTPLEHLGEEVGRLLAREVHPTELSDAVVAVLEEDAVVERLGPLEADGRVDGLVAGGVELADELVEEQPPQALR